MASRSVSIAPINVFLFEKALFIVKSTSDKFRPVWGQAAGAANDCPVPQGWGYTLGCCSIRQDKTSDQTDHCDVGT